MHILKLLTGAALLAAPISIVSAQSGAPADSSANGSHRGWLAGTGAAAGAGLFLAFTHHSQSDAGSVSLAPPEGNGKSAGAPGNGLTPSPAGGSSPASPGASGGAGNNTTESGTPGSPPAGDQLSTDSTQSQGKSMGPQNDGPKGPSDSESPGDGTFNPGTGDTPHGDMTAAAAETSTVPEPGTLALTATGIIGLLPLVRRRK